jgi:anti-anti-sigma factor
VASTSRVFRPDPRSLQEHEDHHRAAFSAHHGPGLTVTVVVEGEVDASNSRSLAAYIERHIAGSTHLVLDLRMVDFFGTAGFAALHNVNVICARGGATWVLHAGRRVRRLLEICDPDDVLPLGTPQSVLDDVRARPGDRKLLVGGNH